MGDVLDVAVIVRRIGRASLTFTVHAFKGAIECVRSTFVTVTTSLVDHKAIALPDDVRLALNAYQSRCENAADIVESRWQEISSAGSNHAAVT
jgi:4-hydroxybenzoyl-CoA thioesterase/acyl-CoA thioester hydrolase